MTNSPRDLTPRGFAEDESVAGETRNVAGLERLSLYGRETVAATLEASCKKSEDGRSPPPTGAPLLNSVASRASYAAVHAPIALLLAHADS